MNRSVWLPMLRRARRVVAGAAAAGGLVLVPACQIPNNHPAEPGAPLPATFGGVATPDNSALLRVDEFFDDPILVNLIRQALAGNQDLKILAQDIQIAQNEVLMRTGAYLPMAAIRVGAGFDKSSLYTRNGAVDSQLSIAPGRPFPSPLPDYLVGADVSWQIDIWRKLRNARDAAKLRVLATADGRNYVITRLVAQVAENYYSLLALDARLATLDQTIAIQQKSLDFARLAFEAGRGTELPVRRFEAEVRNNQSERLVVRQEIIETENRINFLAGRYPQPVERPAVDFLNITLTPLRVGIPSQLLQNRPDLRQAERELAAAGLEVKVARAEFFPSLNLTSTSGYEAWNPQYLFNPEAFAATVAGNLVTPLVNRRAIQAVFGTATARQKQAVYNYQRVVLDAFTELINRITTAENYRQSIELKRQQIQALDRSVTVATDLFQAARGEYLDVLFSQRDRMNAQMAVIETKRQQLAAIVNAYQALGGGCNLSPGAIPGLPGGLPPVFLPPGEVPPAGPAVPPAGNGVPVVPAVPGVVPVPAVPVPLPPGVQVPGPAVPPAGNGVPVPPAVPAQPLPEPRDKKDAK